MRERLLHSVASVTSVSGPNHGSELADFLRKALTPGGLPEHVAETVATLFADFLSLSAVIVICHKMPSPR
jgi:glycerol-3-phosphate dehydrogenase